MAASGAQWRLASEPKARPDDCFYLSAYMLGYVCHIGGSSVTGNHLRSLPRLTHDSDILTYVAPQI